MCNRDKPDLDPAEFFVEFERDIGGLEAHRVYALVAEEHFREPDANLLI